MPKDIDAKESGIGAATKRREDIRFLTGTGNYTDDINVNGQAYVHFLRSDVAHGRITSLDTVAAAGMPGVLRVFTGADFEGVGGLPCGWQVTDRFGEVMQEPAQLVFPAQVPQLSPAEPLGRLAQGRLPAVRVVLAVLEVVPRSC